MYYDALQTQGTVPRIFLSGRHIDCHHEGEVYRMRKRVLPRPDGGMVLDRTDAIYLLQSGSSEWQIGSLALATQTEG